MPSRHRQPLLGFTPVRGCECKFCQPDPAPPAVTNPCIVCGEQVFDDRTQCELCRHAVRGEPEEP